ncbi:MAG: fimbria major subunit [Muribaculaceae bacterium]|nr:fimbria major subunit [Muribaculaceae bacterium]
MKKRKNYIYIALSAFLLLLSGCSEIYDSGDNIPVQQPDLEESYLYMAINIANVDDITASRADGGFDSAENDKTYTGDSNFIYNKGLEEERNIFNGKLTVDGNETSANFAIIFDEDGKMIGDLMSAMLWITPDPIVDEEDARKEYQNYYFMHKKEDFKLREEDGVITYLPDEADKILVILNASEDLIRDIKTAISASDSHYKNLTEILACSSEGTNSEYLYLNNKGRKYFTMSSSMVISNAEKTPYNIGELKFYESRLEAEKNPLSMYVERMQAKHTLLFQKKGESQKNNYYYFGSGVSYEIDGKTYYPQERLVLSSTEDFEPFNEYKTLNYVKTYERNNSIKDLSDPASSNPKLEIKQGNWRVNIVGWAMNAEEKQEYLLKNITNTIYFGDWHKYPHRSFWAEDPNYRNGTYPDQYRKINGEGNNLEDEDVTLNYYPYSSLLKREVHQYTPENTFDLSSFTNLPEDYNTKKFLRVGTHVIVAAQMVIDGFENTGAYSDNPSFDDKGLITGVNDKYCMNGIYWSEEAYKEYVAEYLGYWMLTSGNQNEEKFGENDGNFYTDEAGSKLAYGSDFEILPAHIAGGDGYVYIKPKTGTTLYTNEGKVITDDLYMGLLNEHKEFFAGHFNEGRMYYPIAIRHNYRNTTSPLIALGDYGVVRNHWYFFTIDNINQPGIPVDNPEEEIIPNPEPEYEGLGVNISILNWHNLQENVDLNDQVRPSDTSK